MQHLPGSCMINGDLVVRVLLHLTPLWSGETVHIDLDSGLPFLYMFEDFGMFGRNFARGMDRVAKEGQEASGLFVGVVESGGQRYEFTASGPGAVDGGRGGARHGSHLSYSPV